jgi:hypothetical protein
VPYSLLLIINCLIILKATQFTRARRATNPSLNGVARRTQMTRMILLITFLFILLTLPSAIISGYFFGAIYQLEYGKMAINLINAIQFTYPVFNFFIMFFTNKLFEQEVKSLFSGIRINTRVTTSNQLAPRQNETEEY